MTAVAAFFPHYRKATLRSSLAELGFRHGAQPEFIDGPIEPEGLLKNTPSILIFYIESPLINVSHLIFRIRNTYHSGVPIVVLGGIDNSTQILKFGADLVISPDVEPRILAEKISDFISKTWGIAHHIINIGPVSFNVLTRRAEKDGKDLGLTNREGLALELLLRNKGKTITRQEILTHIYGNDTDISENSIKMLISSLRQKLSHASSGLGGRTILTVSTTTQV